MTLLQTLCHLVDFPQVPEAIPGVSRLFGYNPFANTFDESIYRY